VPDVRRMRPRVPAPPAAVAAAVEQPSVP
jgi:hypothetical protein